MGSYFVLHDMNRQSNAFSGLDQEKGTLYPTLNEKAVQLFREFVLSIQEQLLRKQGQSRGVEVHMGDGVLTCTKRTDIEDGRSEDLKILLETETGVQGEMTSLTVNIIDRNWTERSKGAFCRAMSHVLSGDITEAGNWMGHPGANFFEKVRIVVGPNGSEVAPYFCKVHLFGSNEISFIPRKEKPMRIQRQILEPRKILPLIRDLMEDSFMLYETEKELQKKITKAAEIEIVAATLSECTNETRAHVDPVLRQMLTEEEGVAP